VHHLTGTLLVEELNPLSISKVYSSKYMSTYGEILSIGVSISTK
jgi:hypothetical protein